MNLRHIFIATPVYPIFCFTLALITGIWWQRTDHTCYFYIFITTLCVGAIFFNKRLYACSPIFIVFYGAAFLLGSGTYSHITTSQTEFCNATNNKKYDITVKINSITPSQKAYMGYSCICTLKTIQSPENLSVKYFRDIHLLIYIPSTENISVGDTILIKNVHFKTPKNKNYLSYLLKNHITTSVSALKSHIEVTYHPRYSISRTITAYIHNLNTSFRSTLTNETYCAFSSIFRSTLTNETYCAFSSIFLGDPSAKKKVVYLKKHLNYWGILHYIARSGLHLLIFVSIWMFILSYIPLPWIIRQLCMLLLVLLYNLLSWPSIPFSRALYTFILIKSTHILNIKTYTIPTLSCVTCITLLSNPLVLFSLDFQLSFGITYALAWFNEIRMQNCT
jgi:competence protein ComEC